jgi:tetratricopeptide (TPR) repeat protein
MAGHANHPPETAHPPGGSSSLFRRKLGELRQLPAWARKNPLRALATASVILGIPFCLWLVSLYFLPTTTKPPATIDDALHALDAGDYSQARKLALEVRARPDLSYRDMAGPLYVLGMALSHDAGEHWNRDEQKVLYLIAAKYLQEARDREFPAGREAEGLFQLGRCWHLAGEPANAISALLAALEQPTRYQGEVHRLLAEAYLQLEPPRLPDASKYNQAYLAEPSLPPLARQEGQLRESQIRLALGDLAGCRKSLEEISTTTVLAPEVAILKGQMLIAEADALRKEQLAEESDVQSRYRQAVEVLRGAPSRDNLQQGPPAAAQYLLGVAYERLGDNSAAEAQFSRIRRLHANSPERLPASVWEVELLARRKNYADAVQLAVKTLTEAERAAQERNPWMTSIEIQQRISALHQQLVDTEQFDYALELAKVPAGWIPQWQLTLWEAESHVAHASMLEREAARASLDKGESLRAKARADHRQAGDDYAKLAVLRETTRHYTEDIWNSGEQYFAGRDFKRCVSLVRKYLRNESKKRRPDALLLLGQSLLALDQLDPALECLSECMQNFPKHPATYRARVIAAEVYAEKGMLADAKVLLTSNVESDELSPRSSEWRDSLFLLGRLLYREGMEWEAKSRAAGVDGDDLDRARLALRDLEQAYQAFRQAIDHLDKAVQRYPEAAQAKEAQFFLADAHRQAAKWPRKRLRVVTIEAMRAALARQAQQDLETAVEQYDKLVAQLGEIQESPNHSLLEKRILRNSCFAKGDALFDLGRYDDAVRAYSVVTNRYQSQPESLEAYVQIAACYRILDKAGEARGTLEQAKIMLSRMKQDANFTQTTPYTRDEWSQLLTWLATL